MILLDTHAVLWLAETPDLLSARATQRIADERQHNGLAIADKTLWEIAHLAARGRVKLQSSLQYVLSAIEQRFVVLPITSTVAGLAVGFSKTFPKDPTDRLIAATALANSLPLVTADKAIRQSGEVPCIW